MLQVVDGDREAFASGDERAVEALYNIDRVRLDRLAPRSSSRTRVRGVAAARCPTRPPDDRRLRLARRLVEDPAVYLADLPGDEHAHFRQTRRELAERVCALTGLVAEHRAEGTILVDPTLGEATDLRFPTFQRDRQAALLIGAGIAADTARARSRTTTSAGSPATC